MEYEGVRYLEPRYRRDTVYIDGLYSHDNMNIVGEEVVRYLEKVYSPTTFAEITTTGIEGVGRIINGVYVPPKIELKLADIKGTNLLLATSKFFFSREVNYSMVKRIFDVISAFNLQEAFMICTYGRDAVKEKPDVYYVSFEQHPELEEMGCKKVGININLPSHQDIFMQEAWRRKLKATVMVGEVLPPKEHLLTDTVEAVLEKLDKCLNLDIDFSHIDEMRRLERIRATEMMKRYAEFKEQQKRSPIYG
jgi:predicted ATP-grasp superfamily ATP-dependent carboligase